MITRRESVWAADFRGAQAYTTTAGHMNGLVATTKVGSGTPTLLHVSDDVGAVAITLANDNEAQSQGLSHGDVLSFRLDKIQTFEFSAKVSGVDSVSTLCFGLGSAYNATEDSVATLAWFRIQGSGSTSNVLCETDDGTTDKDDIATGTTLSSTYKRFCIDFQNGLGDVRFFIDGARVAATTLFDMSAVAAGTRVQPYFMVDKASGTGVPALTIQMPCELYYAGSGSGA